MSILSSLDESEPKRSGHLASQNQKNLLNLRRINKVITLEMSFERGSND